MQTLFIHFDLLFIFQLQAKLDEKKNSENRKIYEKSTYHTHTHIAITTQLRNIKIILNRRKQSSG